jgi:hypothetical protein
MNLITVTWYDGKIMEAVLPYDLDTVHSMCMSLESNSQVRQWMLVSQHERVFPFYQESLWKKLIMNMRDWDFS